MRNKLIILTVAGLLVLSVTTTALAFGGGYGEGQFDTCPRDLISMEDQEKFAEVIDTFREKMTKLREEMDILREEGQLEEFRAKHAERFELMEDKRDALSELLPEEYADRFKDSGRSMRNHGWEKNSGGFKSGNCCQ